MLTAPNVEHREMPLNDVLVGENLEKGGRQERTGVYKNRDSWEKVPANRMGQ